MRQGKHLDRGVLKMGVNQFRLNLEDGITEESVAETQDGSQVPELPHEFGVTARYGSLERKFGPRFMGEASVVRSESLKFLRLPWDIGLRVGQKSTAKNQYVSGQGLRRTQARRLYPNPARVTKKSPCLHRTQFRSNPEIASGPVPARDPHSSNDSLHNGSHASTPSTTIPTP